MLRLGVLSTAKIGVEIVLPAIQRSQHIRITAIASRDAGKAAKLAKTLTPPYLSVVTKNCSPATR